MTRVSKYLTKMHRAATLGAAFFLCGPVASQTADSPEQAAPAQTVTITQDDFVITGQVLGYDGTYLRLLSDAGEVTLDFRKASCEGTLCPRPEDYVPQLRLSGAERMSAVLLPALIEGYARDKGLRATRRDIDDSHFEYDLEHKESGFPVLRFAFHVGTSDLGFADLIAGRADGALSVREIRPDETLAAVDAGLGRLSETRRSEIVALDALVPIASPRRDIRSISLANLTRIFSGDVVDWIELGQDPGPIALHLPAQKSGQTQSFVDRMVRASGQDLAANITYHDSADALTRAVAADPNALGVSGYAAFAIARPLALGGNCGMEAQADLLSLKTEDYPLTRPLFLYLPERRIAPEAQDWINWLRSPAAQRVIRRAGFVDRGATPVPLAVQGDRLARALLIAEQDVPLSDVQDMVRKLTDRVRLTTTFRFTPGSTRLDAQSRSNMLQLGRSLRDGAFDGKRLYLVGFSDGQGPFGPNRTLSLARAESVRRALLSAMDGRLPEGVTLEIDAFGEAFPMACDDTDWGRQTNRRVELWVARD